MHGPMILTTELYPHQRAAVDKLRRLRVGALYMEMGTGKTRTALELCKTRLDTGKINRVLWLCPCSVKGNLAADIQKHASETESQITICGIETLSASVETASELLAMVKDGKTMLIVDESSLIKNPNALRSQRITRIAESCRYKLILNGTPVSRNEADLFAQWYLLDWRILGYRSFYSFAANHLEYDKNRPGRIVRALNVDYLAARIEPYTYQCRKEEVMALPDKHYLSRVFGLMDEQQTLYEHVIDTLLNDPAEMDNISIYRLFGALRAVTSGFRVKISDDLHVTREPMFEDPKDNPRIQALLDVIGDIPDNEKVIVFCCWTQEISDIVSVLNSIYPNSAIPFDGTIPQKKRQDAINAFRDKARFFVANISCGAFGLNLQFCKREIFYSLDWNWGLRAQAEDRVHRMGQTEEVTLVDLYASDTIDVQILRCLSRKGGLSESFKQEMTRQNAIAFLKGGAEMAKVYRRQNGYEGAKRYEELREPMVETQEEEK